MQQSAKDVHEVRVLILVLAVDLFMWCDLMVLKVTTVLNPKPSSVGYLAV